jgi:hypothetical protein
METDNSYKSLLKDEAIASAADWRLNRGAAASTIGGVGLWWDQETGVVAKTCCVTTGVPVTRLDDSPGS